MNKIDKNIVLSIQKEKVFIYLRIFINTSHMLADALKYYLSSKPLINVSKMYCEDTINVC